MKLCNKTDFVIIANLVDSDLIYDYKYKGFYEKNNNSFLVKPEECIELKTKESDTLFLTCANGTNYAYIRFVFYENYSDKITINMFDYKTVNPKIANGEDYIIMGCQLPDSRWWWLASYKFSTVSFIIIIILMIIVSVVIVKTLKKINFQLNT